VYRIATGGRARRLVLGTMVVALLAACSDGDGDLTPDTPAPITVSVLAGLNDQQDPNVIVNEFLPEAVSIAAGSTVEWRFSGIEPHSVTFFPKGQTPPPPGADGSLSRPSTPAATDYDGESLVNSGLLSLGSSAPPTFRLTFPTEGRFSFVCVIHPNMTGTVDVAVEGALVDTQPDINERADRELTMWLEEGRAAKRKLLEAGPRQVPSPDDGPTAWTYEMGVTTEHTDVQAFSPASGEVRPGDSVTFVNNTLAPHTATFASGGQNPQNPNDPAVSAPTGPSPLTLTPEGGPFNSGLLPPASPPNPPPEPARSFTFVIPEPGNYPYVCIPHAPSGMIGSITVA